jgi:GNAT superfamily N-acetyltransferase
MNDIIIRPAEPKDIQTLLAFEQGVIQTERPFDPTLKKNPIHYYDLAEMIAADHVRLLVAESQGKLIASGYARIEPDKPYLAHSQRAYLGFMYTLPDWRGKGINKLIIEELIAWSKSRGLNELRLDVYDANENAIRAYEKAGFTRHMLHMRMGLDHE